MSVHPQIVAPKGVVLDSRGLRKLIHNIEAVGGYVTHDGGFQVLLPDSLAHLEPVVMANANELYRAMLPPVRSTRKKRKVCAICKSGAGCRRKGSLAQEQICPICGDACGSHYQPEVYPDITFPGGCGCWYRGADGQNHKCVCPGWPVTPVPVKTKPKKTKTTEEMTMGFLIPESELEAARQKYEAEHPPAKSRAEILIELVKEIPDLTLVEMAEASSRSERWCRKVLKAAGIAVPKAPRRKGTMAPAATEPEKGGTI